MVQEGTKKKYWDVIRRTRKSGRISPSVVSRVEEKWKEFDDDVVEQALLTHIRHYQNYKENYTIGIMRNMQRQKKENVPVKKKNDFNNFHQRNYDYDELEKMLLTAPSTD